MSKIKNKILTPEERVIVTVDAKDDFLRLRHLASDLGLRARSFKLGQGLLLQDRPWALVRSFRSKGAIIDLDAKYEEDPDQMGSVVAGAFERDFSHVSIASAAQIPAFIQAARSTPQGKGLFVSLPSSNKYLLEMGIENTLEANESLSQRQKIQEVMCNVHDIERVKDLGNFLVIATGIRMPSGKDDDHPYVATPAEALAAGADYLAIGRAITRQADNVLAFERVVENMSKCL